MYLSASQNISEILGKIGIYRLGRQGLLDAELSAYYKGFELLENKILQLIKNAFISTSDDVGLRCFESLLGFYGSENSTLDERRQRILSRMNISAGSDIISTFLKTLKGIGIEGTVVEGAYKKQITITINRFSSSSITFVQAAHLVEKILPAHLECIIIYGDNSFDTLEQKNLCWDNLEAKNVDWNGFDFAEKTSP